MFESEQQEVETIIRQFCSSRNIPFTDDFTWNPIPFSGEWGISTSFFKIASLEVKFLPQDRSKKESVQERAQQIAQDIAEDLGIPDGFNRVEAVKGYLNLYFSPSEFSMRVIDTVLEKGAVFGSGDSKNECVMVEFSQPNTHKAFHVGHLRSAILGDALCRILEFAGYEVVRANYYGDIGLHVIRWLWNYMKHHPGEKPPEDITKWMGDLYTEAVQRLEENPELEREVKEVYARWDRQDPQIVNLWGETRQWSIDGFATMYDVLDIKFDRNYSNSEAEKPGKEVVQKLIDDGIALDERPDGPVIVRIDDLLGLKNEKYRVMVILRSDGTALYSTEDLALAIMKFSEYDLARSLYVVDVRQSHHFTQVFKTLDIAGYPWANRCYHLAYELINLPGNVVMASRDGTVVLLEDLIRESTTRAREEVEEKNPTLDEQTKNDVARIVGLGAIKFPMLARDNSKIVTFDWKNALDFNGMAAPYIQYAHVRASSILHKWSESLPEQTTATHDLETPEIELIDRLSRLPNDVQRAASEYKTLNITNVAYETARAFNDFYHHCPVLQAPREIRHFRLRLVKAAKIALKNELNLLGIEAPEVM